MTEGIFEGPQFNFKTFDAKNVPIVINKDMIIAQKLNDPFITKAE